MSEPRRSSVLTWILIGLVVALVLGTAAVVCVPILRCPNCRKVQVDSKGTLVRHLRIDGRYKISDQPCLCCDNRMRVTAVTYGIYAYQMQRRR